MKDFQIQAIGLMSGTSLDGLDVCCCTFRQQAGKWSFHIDCAKGYSYPDAMKQILGTGAQTMSALENAFWINHTQIKYDKMNIKLKKTRYK